MVQKFAMNQSDRIELMSQYALFERQNIKVSGCDRQESNGVIRYISKDSQGSFISYFCIEQEVLEARILDEIAFFKQQGKTFEWKVYETDIPSDIGAALEQHGFIKGEKEAFMVLELEKAPPHLFKHPGDVVRITDKQGVHDSISVQEQVWNRSFSGRKRELLNTLKDDAASMSLYVVYQDNIPVSSARITFNPKSPFSGLWGGSTLMNYRNRGCYSDLLKARAIEARYRGIKYLTIDASGMSRPVVEKLGFEFVTHTIPYEYQID